MLSIIICDDDRFTLEMSASLVKKCVRENGFDASVTCVSSDYNEVFKYLEKHPGLLRKV